MIPGPLLLSLAKAFDISFKPFWDARKNYDTEKKEMGEVMVRTKMELWASKVWMLSAIITVPIAFVIGVIGEVVGFCYFRLLPVN